MSNPRRAVKTALKTTLSSVTGLKSVYTYYPRNQQGMVFPSAVITLEKTAEKAATLGNPGRRHVYYQVTLYIQTIDSNPREDASCQDFDDLLDGIDVALRSDKTLGGAVLKSAWDDIDTDVFAPQTPGQGASLTYRAIKTFPVMTEILG